MDRRRVVVHGYLLMPHDDDRWYALGPDQDLLSARGSDGILLAVAEAVGSGDGLEALRAQMAQAYETEERRRQGDALYARRKAQMRKGGDGMGNRPANSHRCSTCGGTGRVTVGAGNTKCDGCDGNGWVMND